MALKIRLSRAGAKKRPFYRIVIADSRSPRDGRFIEKIGSYDPMLKKEAENRVTLDAERARYWLAKGAQPTDRVARFFSQAGLMNWEPRETPKKSSPRPKTLERMKAAEEAAKAAAGDTPAAS